MILNKSPSNRQIDAKHGLYAAFECIERNKVEVQFGLIKDSCDDGRIIRLRRLTWPTVKSFTLREHEVEGKLQQRKQFPPPPAVTGVEKDTLSSFLITDEPLKDFEEARKILKHFTDARFIEIGRYVRPPSMIVSTFQAVCQILESTTTPLVWTGIQPMIRKKGFLKRILSFDVEQIVEVDQLKKLCKASCGIRVVEKLSCSNEVASALQKWIRALYDYSKQKLQTFEEKAEEKNNVTKTEEWSSGVSPPLTSTPAVKATEIEAAAKVVVLPKIESVLKSCILEVFESMDDVIVYKKKGKKEFKDRPSKPPSMGLQDDPMAPSAVDSEEKRAAEPKASRPTSKSSEASRTTEVQYSAERASLSKCTIHARLERNIFMIRECNEALKRGTWKSPLLVRNTVTAHHERADEMPNHRLDFKTSSANISPRPTMTAGKSVSVLPNDSDEDPLMSLMEEEITRLLELVRKTSAMSAERDENRVRTELSGVTGVLSSHTEEFLQEQRAIRESMTLQIADLHLALKESQQHLEEVSLLYQEELALRGRTIGGGGRGG